MLTRTLLPILALLLAAPVRAAVISDGAEQVAVTIYHEGFVDTETLREMGDRTAGFGMVRETRTVDLPMGISDIQFRGVAATMVPQTADLSGIPDGTIERSFDYNLLSPASLLRKSVGDAVRLVRTDPGTGQAREEAATIVSSDNDTVLRIGDRYEVLSCSGLPEKVIFDRVPDGLMERPTLTVRVRAEKAGRYVLTLRYLATGLNWSADYVARIQPDGRTLNLSGWITLANFGETGFRGATVDVMAGHVEMDDETMPPELGESALDRPRCWLPLRQIAAAPPALSPAPTFVEGVSVESVIVSSSRIVPRDFGDLKQYVLPETTDVAAQQTKQVQFLDQENVPFQRVYEARGEIGGSPEGLLPASVILRLRNTKEAGLGKPLPAGKIATIQNAQDREPLLLGEGSRLTDTPLGLPVEIVAGETTDVWAHMREIERSRSGSPGNRRESSTIEVTLGNSKSEAVEFEWRVADEGYARVTDESLEHRSEDGDWIWRVSLKPGERVELRYTVNLPG
jgi:hypothetical protein